MPIKDAARFRADAARYDRAVAAIASIAGARLESEQGLKAAMATIEAHRSALRLASSKLVVMALDDKVFTSAVVRQLQNEGGARAFTNGLIKDLKAITKLEGAPALRARMVKAMQADGAKLQATSRRMDAAASVGTVLQRPRSWSRTTS